MNASATLNATDEMTTAALRELPRLRPCPVTPPTTPAVPVIRREFTPEHVCLLTFDRPGSSANVFDVAALRELDGHLQALESDIALRGVVLASAKPAIFIAGADLHSLARLGESDTEANRRELADLIELGQHVFSRLAALRVPTVAAIHGACVGGGFELCVACAYRVASTDKATKIGLPETQLGLLPAWGGSTRLPRLIGLPAALDIILAGKTLAPKPALKVGLVDELVPKERLLEVACQRVLAPERLAAKRGHHWKTSVLNSTPVAGLIRLRVRSQVFKKTRGHYPAVLKALEVVTRGVRGSIENSLALERDAMVELAGSESSRNLLRLFLLQERAKKLKPGFTHGAVQPDPTPKPVERCAVIGAGVMGAGIAQWLSARKLSVILRDIDASRVAAGMAGVNRLYEEAVRRRVFTPAEARAGLDRIIPAHTEIPLTGVDFVIEAAVERMDLKQQIFRRLAEVSGPNTILATNTSALSVTQIASATKAPERVVGLHFFNPVSRMQLVEVVPGNKTDPAVLDRTVRFVQQIGKLPVVVADHPGFLVNRVLMPYLVEAGRLFEEGAHIADIDEAMLEFGMPMGPMRLLDEVGLDVAKHVAETLATEFSGRMFVPKVLEEMTKAGLLGRKSERGFYCYEEKRPRPYEEASVFRLNELSRDLTNAQLQARMVLPLVNEAARCLEEGVVSTADDVDFAMVMGTGFAPFRGGPLRYADAVGVGKIVEELEHLAVVAPRFAPCDLLKRMALDHKQFHNQPGGAS